MQETTFHSLVTFDVRRRHKNEVNEVYLYKDINVGLPSVCIITITCNVHELRALTSEMAKKDTEHQQSRCTTCTYYYYYYSLAYFIAEDMILDIIPLS